MDRGANIFHIGSQLTDPQHPNQYCPKKDLIKGYWVNMQLPARTICRTDAEDEKIQCPGQLERAQIPLY